MMWVHLCRQQFRLGTILQVVGLSEDLKTDFQRIHTDMNMGIISDNICEMIYFAESHQYSRALAYK